MPKVRFSAKAGLPAQKGGKKWLHRKGGWQLRADGTKTLVEPIYFDSGKTYEVTEAELAWLLACGPEGCFSEVEAPKPKKVDKETQESD